LFQSLPCSQIDSVSSTITPRTRLEQRIPRLCRCIRLGYWKCSDARDKGLVLTHLLRKQDAVHTAEKNYHTTEREVLGLIYSVTKF